MKRLTFSLILLLLCMVMEAQTDIKDLNIRTRIDSTYAFGFNLKESRSAKGGIWNLKTGKPETPLNYSSMKNDTIDGRPVVMLYRQVVPGNHPLNAWETWVLKDDRWVCADNAMGDARKEE